MFNYSDLHSRRVFLKACPLGLLHVDSVWGCSGEATPPRQTVLLKPPPHPNESVSKFLSRELGHRNWRLDQQGIIDISPQPVRHVSGNLVLPRAPARQSITVKLPAEFNGLKCRSMSIYLERHLNVGPENDRTSFFFTRQRAANFLFPSPGLVKEVMVGPIEFDFWGRIFCITEFENNERLSPRLVLVTISQKFSMECDRSRDYALSYESAVAKCERMRNENWRYIDETIEKCKNDIRME